MHLSAHIRVSVFNNPCCSSFVNKPVTHNQILPNVIYNK
jgi:hypothetical protein